MSGSAITIGNFDGVHVGHRHLFRRVVEAAKARGLTPAVLTFDPHPARLVAPDRAPKLLTTLEERCALMREQGIERVLVLPFTAEIAKLTPEQFVERVAVSMLQGKLVFVGDNFRFGHRQSGDTGALIELGKRYGFETEIVGAVKCRGRVVSSSLIREAIRDGNVALACRFLNQPYALSGDVVAGHGVGAKQTVPTLNLQTSAEVLPRNGVYITCTRDLDSGVRWNSITNIGTRPTFDGDALSIETFLLDRLEGKSPARIRVELLRRVRDEQKFESPEALKAQILRDVARARSYFRRRERWRRELQ
jgi:riboflavin kinase/FMN adenylyltransferase